MDQTELVSLKAHKRQSSLVRSPTKNLLKSSKKKSIFDNFFGSKENDEIIMDNTCDPEFILWKNLGNTKGYRFFMQIRTMAVMLMIVAMTYFGVLYFKEYRSKLFAKILPVLGEKGLKGLSCASMTNTKEEAYKTLNQLMMRKE